MKSWTSSKLALCCSIRSERTERNTHVLIAKFNAIWLFNRSLLEYFFSNPIFFLNISTNTLVKFQKKLNSYFVRKNPSRQIVTKVKTVFMEFRICKKKKMENTVLIGFRGEIFMSQKSRDLKVSNEEQLFSNSPVLI